MYSLLGVILTVANARRMIPTARPTAMMTQIVTPHQAAYFFEFLTELLRSCRWPSLVSATTKKTPSVTSFGVV